MISNRTPLRNFAQNTYKINNQMHTNFILKINKMSTNDTHITFCLYDFTH